MGAGGKARDKYELVQDMFERPIHDAFVRQSGNERFFSNLKENQLDFKRLLYKGNLKCGQDFRIRRVKELFEIEYGKDYKQKGEVGRVCVISHKGEKEQQFLYEGELKMRADGLHCIDGYGRYVYQDQCAVGQFRNHNLHGEAKVIRSCGTVREGIFHQNVMHGPGRVTQTDGTVLEGDFYHGKLSGLGMITKNDGKIIEGQFKDQKLNGEGKITTKDGFVKVGFFQDNLLNGIGKVLAPNGTVVEGEFRNGKLVNGGKK